MIVLDTNVLSELLRPAPNPKVSNWFKTAAGSRGFAVTAITVAELLVGVECLPDGKRRESLRRDVEAALDLLPRQLPFDKVASREFARMSALRKAAGRPIGTEDNMIAAICSCNGMTLATRNVKDFEALGVDLVDPWNG